MGSATRKKEGRPLAASRLPGVARRIYDALLRADQTAARALGERINALPSPFSSEMSIGPCWAGLGTKDAAQEAVDALCDLGWLRAEARKNGGRPTITCHINPLGFFQGFFRPIPRELEEAALTDGTTRLGALYRHHPDRWAGSRDG